MNNRILIEVSGKNINNFLTKIIREKYNIYKLNIVNRNNCTILIDYYKYLELISMRSIYEYKVIKKYGFIHLKDILNINKYLFIFIILGISLLYYLSNIIFEVEIIHTNREVRELIKKELDYYGIKKYNLKKNYKTLERIEDLILESNKKSLEWIEIESIGTKYIIRVEERLINDGEDESGIQDIIASKSAIIKKVFASSGVIMKNTNDYVNKGDVIISGTIVMPRGDLEYTKASGKVYGEVWYTVSVEYPYVYKEETLTGKSKTIYTINFLNKRLSLFNFKKYDTFKFNNKLLFKDNLSFISFNKEKQYEMHVIDELYTKDEVIVKALEKASKEMENTLNEGEEITYYKPLNIVDKGDTVVMEVFFKVIEEIGVARSIVIPDVIEEQ